MNQEPVVIRQSKDEERDQNILKVVLFALCGAGFAYLTSASFNQFLVTASYPFLWVALVCAALFFVMALLQTFFIKGTWMMRATVLVGACAALVPFIDAILPTLSPALLAGAILFVWGFLTGVRRGQRALANSITVRFFEIAKITLPKIITGFFIFFSIAVYVRYVEQNGFNEAIGRDLLTHTLSVTQPALGFISPRLSFNQSVSEFLGEIVFTKVGNEQSLTSGLKPSERIEVAKRAAEELRQGLEKTVGKLDPAEPVAGAIYRIVRREIVAFAAKSQQLFSGIVILFVFSILKSGSWLVVWFIELLAYLAFKLCVATGIARNAAESRTREFIILP